MLLDQLDAGMNARPLALVVLMSIRSPVIMLSNDLAKPTLFKLRAISSGDIDEVSVASCASGPRRKTNLPWLPKKKALFLT